MEHHLYGSGSEPAAGRGQEVSSTDVARLSPLVYKHINFQGRYSFALSETVAQGALRPLRNPYEEDE